MTDHSDQLTTLASLTTFTHQDPKDKEITKDDSNSDDDFSSGSDNDKAKKTGNAAAKAKAAKAKKTDNAAAGVKAAKTKKPDNAAAEVKSAKTKADSVRILVLFYLNRELYYLQFYGRLHYTYTCTKTRHNTLKSVMGRRRVKRM